jgi:hypothetical protein
MTLQTLRIATVMACLAGIALLTACTKESLSKTAAPTGVDATTGAGAKTAGLIIPTVCQITNMGGNGFYTWREGLLSKIDYTNITYNSDALPARAKHSESSDDSVVSNFYYDASKRLSKITTSSYPHSHQLLDFSTDYYSFNYLANGTLLVNYYYVTPLNPAQQEPSSYLLEFDASHRVTKRSHTDGNGLLLGYLHYIYRSDGNVSDVYTWSADEPVEKLFYHFISYDTKRNFCTTNSVWQLLLDQYSPNNPTEYTEFGDYDYMGYEYNNQNEPTVVQHYDVSSNYSTTNPIGYSCSLLFHL